MTFVSRSSVAIGKSTAGAFLRRAGDIALNLRVTEKIITEIERRLFTPDPTQFSIELVKSNLQKLKTLPPDTPSDDFLPIEFSLDQEFNLWRGLLEERDRKIETYHLRRFFDTANQKFDPAVFSALAYFYRSSPMYLSHLSKFDLVLTRLYSVGEPPKRGARLMREARIEEIRLMFANWDGSETMPAKDVPEEQDAVTRLDEYIFEAHLLSDFEELIRSNIFDRLRTFKREIGRVFFEPEVAAVSIECNLILGNVFSELLTRANQNLGEKLSASFDFAGAFHDTSPETRVHISQILSEIRAESAAGTAKSDRDDVDHIWKLLDMVCGSAATGSVSGTIENNPASAESSAETATERLRSLFETLNEVEPDVRMLREYTQRSKSLWTIDLNDFIRNDEPELDRLCRDVLRIILITDELCTHELNQPRNVPQETYDELSGVFRRSVDLGDVLEELLGRYTGALQNRLLVVSNKFLETRLRLERTIVRFSNHHLGMIRTETPEAAETPEPVQPLAAVPKREPRMVSRWLVVLTFVVGMLCAGAYFASDQFEGFVPVAQDFEELRLEELPTNEHLLNVYRQKSTLFVITKDSWESLQDEQKRTALEKFTDVPAPVKIEVVVVTNAAGRPVADLSSNGVNLSPDL